MTVHQVWRKSTYSGNGPNCVEVRAAETAVHVRDTKNRSGGTIAFGAEQWQAFVRSARPEA